jgi:hypothetical protein
LKAVGNGERWNSWFLSMLALAMLVLTVAAPSAHALSADGDADDRRCRDEYNRHADCSRNERRKEHAAFGLPSIETMHRQQRRPGDVVVAIASLKLAGSLALIFRRGRDGAPMAEVHRAPPWGAPYPPMRVRLADAAWQTVVTQARALDMNLYEDDRICTGGAGFSVQTIDDQGQFRSRMGDVCSEHLGNALFAAWGNVVIAELPQCAALVPDGYDGGWVGKKLLSCFLLAGDRTAAGEVFNLMEAQDFWPSWSSDADEVGALFAPDVTISWPGLPPFGDPDDAAAFLTGGWLAPFRFETTAYVGETADRVRVEGEINAKENHGKRPKVFGRFQSVWTRDKAGGFKMTALTVRKD